MFYFAIDEAGTQIAGGWMAQIHDLEQKLLSHLADKQMMNGKIIRHSKPSADDVVTIANYQLTIDDDVLSLEKTA